MIGGRGLWKMHFSSCLHSIRMPSLGATEFSAREVFSAGIATIVHSPDTIKVGTSRSRPSGTVQAVCPKLPNGRLLKLGAFDL